MPPPRQRPVLIRVRTRSPPSPPSAQEAGFKPEDAQCLRKCVEAIRRINAFRNLEGRGQANFVRSMLDVFGADEGERLPLGTVLT